MNDRFSNANSSLLSALLADANLGTFSSLAKRKKGVERGPKGNKVVYGDDLIFAIIITGFKYLNLVKRDLKALMGAMDDEDTANDAAAQEILDAMNAKGVLCWTGRGKTASQVTCKLDDVKAALVDLVASCKRSLDPTEESASTTKAVYDSLVVAGETVRGSRVYRCKVRKHAETGDDSLLDTPCECRDCVTDREYDDLRAQHVGPFGQDDEDRLRAKAAKAAKRRPLDGTIYLQGLQVYRRVEDPAPNGPKPASKSGGKVVAKGFIKRHLGLPSRRYVSYALEPGTDFILKAGGTAETEATDKGFVVNDDVVDVLRNAGHTI